MNKAEHLSQTTCSQQEVGACAGDEAYGISTGLHILPEMHVGVVEDVGVKIQVVECLRGEHHANIVPLIQQGNGLQKEV